jgi:hypothetical protein
MLGSVHAKLSYLAPCFSSSFYWKQLKGCSLQLFVCTTAFRFWSPTPDNEPGQEVLGKSFGFIQIYKLSLATKPKESMNKRVM